MCVSFVLIIDIVVFNRCLLVQKTLSDVEVCSDAEEKFILFDEIKFHSVGNKSSGMPLHATHPSNYKWSSDLGYTFTADFPVRSKLLDSFFFCKLRNKNGQLDSSLIEIQDVDHYHSGGFCSVVWLCPSLPRYHVCVCAYAVIIVVSQCFDKLNSLFA